MLWLHSKGIGGTVFASGQYFVSSFLVLRAACVLPQSLQKQGVHGVFLLCWSDVSCGSPSLAVLGHGGDVAGSQGRACHTTLQDLRELGVGSDHERTCNSYFKIAIDQVIKTG